MSECAQCGAQMQEGQDWCLQCGAGAPGNLGGGPGWRTGAAILAATSLLAIGASVAAYAALTKSKPKPRVVALLRPATSPVTPIPGGGTAGSPTTGSGGAPGVPTTVTPAPPKIPTQTPTPKGSSSASEPLFPPETKSSTSTSTSTKTTNESSKASKEEGAKEGSESQSGHEPPSPILLDTNAASVYNPYAYPASLFGDPSLVIDGEDKTAWTAQVQAEKAPHMAEGLVLDLKTAQKLSSATVKTSTTGATVEIYGANGSPLPASITDPAWVRLVGLKVLKQKTMSFTLKTNGKSFRYVVLWLVKAPAGSTASNPGHVAINEFELFPPS